MYKVSYPYRRILIWWTIILPNLILSKLTEFLWPDALFIPIQKCIWIMNYSLLNLILVGCRSFYAQVQSFIPIQNGLIWWTILLPNPIPSRLTEFLCQVAHTKWYLNDEQFFYRIWSPVGWWSYYDQVQRFMPIQKGTYKMNNSLPNQIPGPVGWLFLWPGAKLHTHTNW
jgi:hypothetical protein